MLSNREGLEGRGCGGYQHFADFRRENQGDRLSFKS